MKNNEIINPQGQKNKLVQALPLERFLQSSSQLVSWLAASPYSLRLGATASAQGEALPKVRGLSGLRRFRSAYSCGAALVLHQLP